MLKNIRQLYGKTVSAMDGTVGRVEDFYFDDRAWALRYVVVDTGSWLEGCQVLLTSHAFDNQSFGLADAEADVLHVNMTRSQIQNSPPFDSRRPISRQYEEAYHDYYDQPAYWLTDDLVPPAETPEYLRRHGPRPVAEFRLRSTTAVTNYHIQTRDGPIGAVSSFVVDGRTWEIRELVVETGRWYSGKEVLLLPANIERINYGEAKVFVNLSKEDIQQTMSNDVAQAGAGYR